MNGSPHARAPYKEIRILKSGKFLLVWPAGVQMVKRGRKIPLILPAFNLTRYPPSERRALLSERLEQAIACRIRNPGLWNP